MDERFTINPKLLEAYQRIEENRKRLKALEVSEREVPSDAIGVIGVSNWDLQSLVSSNILPASVIERNAPPYVREIAFKDPGYLYYYLPFLEKLSPDLSVRMIRSFTNIEQFQRNLGIPKQLGRATSYAYQRAVREGLLRKFGINASGSLAEDMCHHLLGSDAETLRTGYGLYGSKMSEVFDAFRDVRSTIGDAKLLQGLESALSHKGALVFLKNASVFEGSRPTPEDESELLYVTKIPITLDDLCGISFLSDLDRDEFENMDF